MYVFLDANKDLSCFNVLSMHKIIVMVINVKKNFTDQENIENGM